MHEPGNPVKGYWLFLVIQIIFVIIFAVLGKYDKGLLPQDGHEGGEGAEFSMVEVPQSKYPRM